MSTIRQYFDTDFDHALRVNIGYPAATIPCVGALLYDAAASSSFLAFYFEDSTLKPEQFEAFVASITYGTTQVTLQGGVRLPSLRWFHGALRVHNTDPFKIEYQFFGDPSWHDLLAVTPSRRMFIYAETSFSPAQVTDVCERRFRAFFNAAQRERYATRYAEVISCRRR